MFGASDRVAGDEMHSLGHMRGHVANDGAFHRADIGEDAARLKMRADLGGDRTAGADRHAQDDEIGALDGVTRVGVGLGDKPEPQRRCPRRLGLGGADDLSREPRPSRRVADRGTDQADADQRDALEHGLRCVFRPRVAHALLTPVWPAPVWLAPAGWLVLTNSVSAATTARLSSAVPMVMRRLFGKP